MAAKVWMIVQDLFVNEQTDLVFRVVHQAKDTDGTGSNVQILFHEFRFSKGKAGAADLLGENCRFEFFVARKEQQVKGCFLGIAEKQVFADLNA